MLIISNGCSTQENKFLNRAYHTINAKYNGFFNARESYHEGLNRLEDSHQDNYENILDIFKYGSEQDVASISSYMNVAYEKSSVVIQRHSMNIRGVEYNKWIDNAYFLIARSHFFKRDYNLAILTFEYIIRQYDTPLQYYAKIWIAKTYNYMGRYNDAMQVLELLQRNYNNGVLPEESHRLYFLVYADHYYKQNIYREAIPYMEKAIEFTNRRSERTRLVFILGQTYQEIGGYANAQKAYSRVLRLNPDFDMEFRARINMAMSYDPQMGGGRRIKEELENMLDNDRNRNYRDQIYYALAQLSEGQDLKDEAIDYYLRSTKVSEGNNLQKSLSFLRLGQLFYEDEEYYQASIYYDSTVVFLPGDYDNIEEITRKSNVLNDLALNIRLISREDSLQHLASLPQAERNRIIDEIIQEQREKDRLEREREREMMLAGQGRGGGPAQQGMIGAGQGGWYFYNPSAISFGQTEFTSRWGQRKLEDLWRISNKQTYSFDDMAMGDTDSPDDFEVEQEQYSRDTYIANLPLTPEELEESNNRVIQAYYNKGLIYKNRLHNNEKAIHSFKALLNKFPGNEHELYVYYFLYDIYDKSGIQSEANIFKNKIINEYPETDFARILSDPDYAENVRNRQDVEKRLYKDAYDAYKNKDYQKVIMYCNQADTIDLNRELAAKFTFLKALAYGGEANNEEFSRHLNIIVESYEGTEVFDPARSILAYTEGLDGPLFASYDTSERSESARDVEIKEEEDKEDAVTPSPGKTEPDGKTEPGGVTEATGEFHSIYEYKPDNIHFFVFVVNVSEIDIRQLRTVINEFNRATYPGINLTLSNIFLEGNKQILTVTNFENSEKSMDYLESVTNSERLSVFDQEHLVPFTISVENYPVFYQEKNVEEYISFFNYFY